MRGVLHQVMRPSTRDLFSSSRYPHYSLRIDLFSFNLKGLIDAIPFAGSIYIFQGLSALIIFIIYLSTMWHFAHPAYNMIFGTDIGKWRFISGNIRFNIPVLFPWLMLSIVTDLITTSLQGLKIFLDSPAGQ
jgi:hypothetical protein